MDRFALDIAHLFAGGLVTVLAVGVVIHRATRVAREEGVPPEVAPA